ncbi:ROK family protein [Kocuria sp. JC486]|uniref:ROK family protein n=1 Tax=Kocuria soli TaxID=2485125 RepID=A0A3N3ZRL1_9MICC|nr:MULTISPECIES: ROK family protein [Kocuria]NHU84396.1 ROK family protein [Kocuria sp. JC486]ROZ63980.1 ROK family protein [Kocuria soli]
MSDETIDSTGRRADDPVSAASKGSTTSPRRVIGIDVGGTGVKGGIVDLEVGDLIGERYRIPTPKPATPEAVAKVIKEIVDELQTRDGAPDPHSPIGVIVPSIVKDGVTLLAANIDPTWVGADIAGLLEKTLGRPVAALNDADGAGLAESLYGAGKGVSGTVLVMTLGTGIGSALIVDGRLVPNAELGHLELDGHDAETRASATARERDDLSFKKWATQRLQPYFEHVEMLFTPSLFVIGGGVSKKADKFLPLLELRTPIEVAQLRNNAGIVGAALWAERDPGTADS